MKSLNRNHIIRTGMILIGLVLIGRFTQIVFTEDKPSEKDKIIANLKNEHTLPGEVARIKEIRSVQIQALLYIISDFQQGLRENRACLRSPPVEAAIELAGDIRAAETVESIISVVCVTIDKLEGITVGSDGLLASQAIKSASLTALTKIDKPAVSSLINSLKVETVDLKDPFTHISSQVKSQFLRKTLYLIEGEFTIYYLEKALKEETDKKKKENLSEAIAKFREELKAGVYNK